MVPTPSLEVLDITSAKIYQMNMDVALLGMGSSPDPYPLRTSHIG